MKVRIDCYGVTERLSGLAEHCLELLPGARVADALAALTRGRPELGALLPQCACAVGDAVVPRTRPLADGERLALLPPVSGG
jgi:molybdopterin converting factor small subunit